MLQEAGWEHRGLAAWGLQHPNPKDPGAWFVLPSRIFAGLWKELRDPRVLPCELPGVKQCSAPAMSIGRGLCSTHAAEHPSVPWLHTCMGQT